MQQCLISVAELELNALMREAKNAIDGLKYQRESVMQAIRATQHTSETSSDSQDNSDVLVEDILHRLRSLSAALDRVKSEIELLESMQVTSDVEPPIVWYILPHLPSDVDHLSVHANEYQPTHWPEGDNHKGSLWQPTYDTTEGSSLSTLSKSEMRERDRFSLHPCSGYAIDLLEADRAVTRLEEV